MISKVSPEPLPHPADHSQIGVGVVVVMVHSSQEFTGMWRPGKNSSVDRHMRRFHVDKSGKDHTTLLLKDGMLPLPTISHLLKLISQPASRTRKRNPNLTSGVGSTESKSPSF